MNLNPIHSFAPPRTEYTAQEDTREREESILSKIWGVVQKILLGLANALFFLTNPTLYSISFLIGFIWNDQVQIVIDKIISLWINYSWVMVPLTVAASFLSLQVTWAVTSSLFAAHLGATLSKKAEEFVFEQCQDKQEIKKPQDTFKLL